MELLFEYDVYDWIAETRTMKRKGPVVDVIKLFLEEI